MVYDIFFSFNIDQSHDAYIYIYVQYSPTNLVREHKRAVPFYSTWQWPRASTHTHTTDTCLVMMITSSCQEYWREGRKRLNGGLIGRIWLPTISHWRWEKKENPIPFFFFYTYLDQFVITWFIIALAKEYGSIWNEQFMRKEQNIMEKTCWTDIA
jgi:hypothetical protein